MSWVDFEDEVESAIRRIEEKARCGAVLFAARRAQGMSLRRLRSEVPAPGAGALLSRDDQPAARAGTNRPRGTKP